MNNIKVPMIVRIYAGDVLIAEADDADLFSAVMAAILPKRCLLCSQTPSEHCCHHTAATQPEDAEVPRG